MDKLKKQALKKIAKKYKLELIILFGSIAKGKARKESDADIAVKSGDKLNFSTQLQLTVDLREVFDREIDLSIIEHSNPLLLRQIFREGKLIFGAEREFSRLSLYSFHRYNDYKPYFQREEKFVKQTVGLRNK